MLLFILTKNHACINCTKCFFFQVISEASTSKNALEYPLKSKVHITQPQRSSDHSTSFLDQSQSTDARSRFAASGINEMQPHSGKLLKPKSKWIRRNYLEFPLTSIAYITGNNTNMLHPLQLIDSPKQIKVLDSLCTQILPESMVQYLLAPKEHFTQAQQSEYNAAICDQLQTTATQPVKDLKPNKKQIEFNSNVTQTQQSDCNNMVLHQSQSTDLSRLIDIYDPSYPLLNPQTYWTSNNDYPLTSQEQITQIQQSNTTQTLPSCHESQRMDTSKQWDIYARNWTTQKQQLTDLFNRTALLTQVLEATSTLHSLTLNRNGALLDQSNNASQPNVITFQQNTTLPKPVPCKPPTDPFPPKTIVPIRPIPYRPGNHEWKNLWTSNVTSSYNTALLDQPLSKEASQPKYCWTRNDKWTSLAHDNQQLDLSSSQSDQPNETFANICTPATLLLKPCQPRNEDWEYPWTFIAHTKQTQQLDDITALLDQFHITSSEDTNKDELHSSFEILTDKNTDLLCKSQSKNIRKPSEIPEQKLSTFMLPKRIPKKLRKHDFEYPNTCKENIPQTEQNKVVKTTRKYTKKVPTKTQQEDRQTLQNKVLKTTRTYKKKIPKAATQIQNIALLEQTLQNEVSQHNDTNCNELKLKLKPEESTLILQKPTPKKTSKEDLLQQSDNNNNLLDSQQLTILDQKPSTHILPKSKKNDVSASTPNRCEKCGIVISTKSNLKTHMKIHNKPKPIPRPIKVLSPEQEERMFTKRLLKYIGFTNRGHALLLSCDICKTNTKTHIKMVEHMARFHTPNCTFKRKTYRCSICNFRTIFEEKLISHKLNAHRRRSE